jgi:hypothetical protein
MTRTEQAIQRRRMTRKIRETVALRRFTATMIKAGTAEPASPEPAEAARATAN